MLADVDGGHEAEAVLLELLQDPSDNVRAIARRGLRRLGFVVNAVNVLPE